jgi:hypothetical protein
MDGTRWRPGIPGEGRGREPGEGGAIIPEASRLGFGRSRGR